MEKLTAIIVTIFLSNGELAAFILIYVLMNTRKELMKGIFEFQFRESSFDLLIISLIRYCIIVGAFSGLFYDKGAAVKRIIKTSKLIIYFSCLVAIYIVLKILYCAEDTNLGISTWLLIGLLFVSCFTIYLYWKMLCSIRRPSATFKKSLLVNSKECVEEDSLSESSSSSCSSKDENQSNENLNDLDKKQASSFSTGSTVWKLLKMARNDVFYLFLALLSLIVCSAGQIFLPYYTGQVVNYIVIEKSVEKFKESMMYMALITVFAGFTSGTRAGLFTFVNGRYMIRLQKKLFSHIIKMEIGFFDQRKTGEITSRLTSDCTKVGDGVGLNVNVFLRNVVKIIGVLFFMLKISWKLSIVTLVSIPVIAVISEAFGEKYRKLSEKVQNSLAKANENADEAISNIRTVRSFAAEEQESKRYGERLDVAYKLYKEESIIVCFYRWCTEITDLAMTLLILYYGGHLVIRNELSGGSLVSFILYSIELGFAFEEIGDVYTGVMEAVGASKNVLVYIERKPKIDFDGQIKDINVLGNIKFQNVSFSYPSRENMKILDDVSFEAEKGEVVALVGPSGGGKSSIVNLLEHFYESSHGKILIDNIPLKSYEHHFLHKKMSLVQQEPVLFARTIRENISYGCQHDCKLEDIVNSAIMANAHLFIEGMPEKYDTETGEKGVQLSGGQKQRIAIARALIRNPSILILDEATSALDSESEYIVQQAINKNLLGRTVIIIAHRLSTIEKADKILVIDKGKIVEQGTHKDLLSCGGLYSQLVKRQLLGVDGVKHSEETPRGLPLEKRKSSEHVTPKSSFSRSNIHL